MTTRLAPADPRAVPSWLGGAVLAAAAAALLALALAGAPDAAAAPSAGDRAAERALAATGVLERRQTTIVRSVRRAVATRRVGPVVRQSTAMTRVANASARRAKGARPTSPQGKRVRRYALQVSVLYRQWAVTTGQAWRAAGAGRRSTATRLARRADRLDSLIDARLDAARRIVVPDPTADVGALEFLGFIVSTSTATAPGAPIAAPDGGTITACGAAQRAIGMRYVVRGVTGRVRVDFALVQPDGVTRPFPGIVAEPSKEGHTFTASTTRNVTNGVWRWQASVNGRLLLDVAVTRACT